MARVVVTPSFCTEYFGSDSAFDLPAANLFQLVDALERRAPGFAEAAGIKVAFAIDGVVQNDWTAPLGPDSEVLLVPRIGGG